MSDYGKPIEEESARKDSAIVTAVIAAQRRHDLAS